MEQQWEIDNLPNRITLFRILLIPIVVMALWPISLNLSWLEPYHKTLGYIAGWIFVLAAVTDYLDGYIARKRDIVTVFGSFLDPIADKFLVVTSLILLQGLDRIPSLIVLILVLREIYITALRLLATDHGINVPVGQMGKWKTAMQMIGIPLLMAYDKPFGIPFPILGSIFIYLASLFSIYSALQYSLGLVKKIQQKRKDRKKHFEVDHAEGTPAE